MEAKNSMWNNLVSRQVSNLNASQVDRESVKDKYQDSCKNSDKPKRKTSAHKRPSQPSVLSRIKETPIWASHVQSSTSEKRPASLTNSVSDINKMSSFDAEKIASIANRRVSLPLTPRPVNSPRNRNTGAEVEILRSLSATDILTNPPATNFQRLPISASILVMGLAHSGKSSMVRFHGFCMQILFASAEVTCDYLMNILQQHYQINAILSQSVCSISSPMSPPEMHEYVAQIKVPDSSGFYTLRIIDCPGYRNNTQTAYDAALLTTLLSYLDSKDGLRGRVPSLVLIVLKFTSLDNPAHIKDIINFLKVINHFQRHFNNVKFPNFVFVLTHFKSASQEDQTNPYLKCQKLQNLIEKHTSLPQPVAIVCAENKGLLNKRNNDFVEILNDEHYPTNLIERMKTILSRKGRDSISETIIRTAFGVEYPHSILLTERNEIRLFDENHPTVINTKKILEQVYADIEWTELSILLQVGWENIDLKLRKRFPSSLLTLQRMLQITQIKSFQQLPDNTIDTLNLIRDLPQNFAVTDLLIHTLQLKVPECIQSKFIGLGYDVRKDSCTEFSAFEFSEKNVTTPVGLMCNELECTLTNDRLIAFKFFNTYQEYVVDRLRDLKLRTYIFPDVTVPNANTNKRRVGYNIVKLNQSDISKGTIVTASVEYHICRVELQDRNIPEFKSPFWDAVSQIPPLDSNDPENIYAWKGFFGFWGTHVVKSGFLGGSIDVTFKGPILSNLISYLNRTDLFPSDNDEISRVFQWITGDGLEIAANGINEGKSSFIHHQDVTACFKGGSDRYLNSDITKVPYDLVAEIRNGWKDSLVEDPIFLETNLTLVPLSHYVRFKCPETASKMDVAFQYIFSNYISPEAKNSSCSIL